MDAIESVSMETCEKNSIKAELLETTGTHEESTKLLDSHAVKNNGKSITILQYSLEHSMFSLFQNLKTHLEQSVTIQILVV